MDLVGLTGLEPVTSRLSGERSNQLSYRPRKEGEPQSAHPSRFLDGVREKGDSRPPGACPMLATERRSLSASNSSVRKEVIQPQVPLRLPCYDLVPVTKLAFGAALLTVRQTTSGALGFRGLTGGVYKAQEHIHHVMADTRLLAIPAS